jgi:hypothetical protein
MARDIAMRQEFLFGNYSAPRRWSAYSLSGNHSSRPAGSRSKMFQTGDADRYRDRARWGYASGELAHSVRKWRTVPSSRTKTLMVGH